jgi:hypothetical protein
MMQSQPCSVTSCLLDAWRSCERCHRPFCDAHARWQPIVFVPGQWATFEFLCYGCLPPIADETDRSDRENEGEGESGT